MAICYNCLHFQPFGKGYRGKCRKDNRILFDLTVACSDYNSFDDELDKYLFENHQVKAGCSSSIEGLKYDIAREVAEKMIKEFHINIQYISREERQKKMDEMYGVNLLKHEE